MPTKERSILIIYTGGTIGMVEDEETGVLIPFNFEQISKQVTELARMNCHLSTITFDPPVDSSNINPDTWIRLASIIEEQYASYDGFVILHGTDTMAFTASALSFMLENLDKPVVLTGSQLPIGTLRTDGKENLISSIEIASAYRQGDPVVPEVCIFFENKLFRGNRTTKSNAEYFNAFVSENYPPLADTGVHIRYNYTNILYPEQRNKLVVHKKLDSSIAVLKIFPGIQPSVVDAMLKIPGLRALVLESFGSGNAPNQRWFIDALKNAVEKGLIIVNVTQCLAGSVEMKRYETGIELMKSGMLSGYDSTTEAAVTKLMFLLGVYDDRDLIKSSLNKSLRGEITIL
ncbi:MAG TPA: asparaginase [Bacteroidales bacterium]|nr:asparaginase [Bacteroidales bacterium]